MRSYSQTRALLAIIKANIIVSFRSPYSVLLGILFPLVFILVFSWESNNIIKLNIVLTPHCDTSNAVYQELSKIPYIHFKNYTSQENIQLALQQNSIVALMDIQKQDNQHYRIHLTSSSVVQERFNLLDILLENIIHKVNDKIFKKDQSIATITTDIRNDKAYTTVDFILPGQLGFSLLTIGIMGVAFSIFHLREALVLKRFRATPIHKINILLGEAIGRIIYQLFTVSILIAIGRLFLGFTLANGIVSYIEMMILCFMGLLVFMGIGFGISGVVRSSHIIPIVGNLLMFPQLMLSGTFFSIDVFPQWLKMIAYCLPLTPLNEALREVAFNGMHLWQLLPQIGALLLWIIIVYTFANKVFKWE